VNAYFQAKTANKAETWELMKTLNSALPLDSQLTDDRLHRQFDRAWPELEQKLSSLPAPQVQEHRSVTEMLAEVLGHVRSIRYQEPATEAEREAMKEYFLAEMVAGDNRLAAMRVPSSPPFFDGLLARIRKIRDDERNRGGAI